MKFKQPKVSIIMNCFNGERFLSESIKSVIKQSYKNWELIFWDNNSTDNSKKICKYFLDKRIKYFYSKRYNTLYKSRNLAIKKAKGKYITFLDVDDLWHTKKIKEQVNFLRNKKIKICYSNLQLFYQKKNKKKKFIKEKKTNITTQNLLNNYDLGILTVMLEKSIFKKKSFNKNYEIIGDFDFFIYLSLNHKIGYLNKVLATYRVHGENFSTKKISKHIDELKKWIKRNKVILEKKGLNLTNQQFFLKKLILKKYLQY